MLNVDCNTQTAAINQRSKISIHSIQHSPFNNQHFF